MRTLIYARVSTSHDQNPDVQIAEMRRYCAARGWTVAHEIVDRGYSGGTDKRPGLKQLTSLIHAREVDAVIVVKMDRLFRSLKHLVSMLEELQSLKIDFVAIKDNVSYDTPSGRLFVQVLGSLAEFEKALIRERTLLGINHARMQGKQLGRPVKHDPEKIRRLRQHGLSFRQIAKTTGAPLGCISRALKGERKIPTVSNSRRPKKSDGYDGV